METTFIIGSNSFSGATFSDFALAQGGKVIGTSRSAEPNGAFLPYTWHDHTNFTFHELDLNQHLKELTELIQDIKPAYVVNLQHRAWWGRVGKIPVTGL